MEYKIQLRNPNTREKTTLTAYTEEMALNMIEQSIKDGWRIKNTDDVKKTYRSALWKSQASSYRFNRLRCNKKNKKSKSYSND